jgi:hypothetical protein
MSLEDIAEIFGDNITLDDPEEEAIHRYFRKGQYRETAIAQAIEELHQHRRLSFEQEGADLQVTHDEK